MLLSGERDDVDIVNNKDENKRMQLLVFFVSIFLSGAPALGCSKMHKSQKILGGGW